MASGHWIKEQGKYVVYGRTVQCAQRLNCGALDLVPDISCITSNLRHIVLLMLPRPDSGGWDFCREALEAALQHKRKANAQPVGRPHRKLHRVFDEPSQDSSDESGDDATGGY